MTAPAPGIETTDDAFLGGALTVRQPRRGYRAGLDAVLLAASCPARAGERIVDVGAGVGTVGLCVAHRVTGANVVLVERDETYATFAQLNISGNGLAGRMSVIEADVTLPIGRTAMLAALIGSFDHALANPPYAIETDGTRAADVLKDVAHTMPAGAFEAWARTITALVKPGGTATFVHRADALPMIFAAMERRFGGLVVRLVHPHADAPANRVLVRGTRDSRAPLTIHPPLVVHDATGAFMPAVSAVLRNGAALTL